MRSSPRTAFSLAFAALTLAAGCGTPPPDTTPTVQITSPLTNQRVKAGQAITVNFKIGGKDGTVDFKLEAADDKKTGRGRIVALVDGYGNIPVSVTNNPAEESLFVPDGTRAKAADVIKAGPVKIQLWLQYNNGDFLSPQRQGEVTVLAE